MAEGDLLENEGQTKTRPRPQWQKRYLGILLALFASLLFPLAGLVVKALLAQGFHPFNVSFWRFQGILLPALPMAFCRRSPTPINLGEDKPMSDKKVIKDIWAPLRGPKACNTIALMMLRGLTGASAVVFQFYSLQYITLADSSVISFSTPVWVTLLAHITLGEKCGFIPIFAGILSLFGVLIISRPPLLTGQDSFDGDTLIGVALALGCMVCATMTFVILRRLRELSYAVLNLSFGLWGSLETLFLSAIIWRFDLPANALHAVLALTLATLSFVSQLCMTLAFKFETASVISLIRTLDVIFTFIWQFIVFQVVPDRFSVIGALVVLTGIGLVGFRKWVTELEIDDPRRKRFALLLI